MDVKKKNGKLVIEVPLETPRLSSSGKTMLVATSGGVKETGVTVEGKRVRVVLSAFFDLDRSATPKAKKLTIPIAEEEEEE